MFVQVPWAVESREAGDHAAAVAEAPLQAGDPQQAGVPGWAGAGAAPPHHHQAVPSGGRLLITGY